MSFSLAAREDRMSAFDFPIAGELLGRQTVNVMPRGCAAD